MKKRINVKNFENKIVMLEKELPSLDHLQSQIKYKHIVFANKKKYKRKEQYNKWQD